MNRIIAAIALAIISSTAAAQEFDTGSNRGVGEFLGIRAPSASHLLLTGLGEGQPAGVRIYDGGGQLRLALTTLGDVEFGHGATIDFAGIEPTAGQFRGWIAVRVAGELMVVPAYAYVPQPPTR